MTACLAAAITASAANAQTMKTEQRGDTTVITIDNPTKYLILPVEENRDERKVKLDTGAGDDTWMDIRLAIDKTDYCVPFGLGKGKTATVKILGLPRGALAFKDMKLSDEWSVKNTEYYRPVYHHTPLYGWMNDANGLVFKDGEYHLYFQYNPYGAKWGNMHWGHSVSRDLVHWQHLDPAIARDTLGHIFSGSTVVDKYNSAGYGKDAIIAFYTSASDEHGQIQCMAYSTDNGRTYTKYENNPVLTPFDGLRDFRDPKVFRYEPADAWYMIISADKEIRFYKSKDLKKWDYVSAFGRGYGAKPNQYECPDFVPMTIGGKQKYVLIVNINPGCFFGGSATEYFIGDFDGKEFKCDNGPETVKWMDYGKDHYATVCFSNTGDRVIAVPWMSNWQYANLTPTQQFRSANALPRELSLFEKDGEIYVAADAIPEAKALRKETKTLKDMKLNGEQTEANPFAGDDNSFEIEADITPGKAKIVGFDMMNAKGEKTRIYLDLEQGRAVMDRAESGITAFGEKADIHFIEKEYEKANRPGAEKPQRVLNAMHYKNDFALATWAPLSLCEGKTYHLDVFVDKSSVELFVDGGRIAMTNLIFPTEPYNSLRFYSEGGKAEVKNVNIHKLNIEH